MCQVQKVIDKGAVVLGKCNMGEFALTPDESAGSAYGIVRNPYDLDRTTAGQCNHQPILSSCLYNEPIGLISFAS